MSGAPISADGRGAAGTGSWLIGLQGTAEREGDGGDGDGVGALWMMTAQFSAPSPRLQAAGWGWPATSFGHRPQAWGAWGTAHATSCPFGQGVDIMQKRPQAYVERGRRCRYSVLSVIGSYNLEWLLGKGEGVENAPEKAWG